MNAEEKFFFESSRPKEELYDLKNDPHELVNLAIVPENKQILVEMRKLTEEYEGLMKPCDETFDPVIPKADDLLNWVRTDKPELYQQMLDGVEIGFQKLNKQYKQVQKEKIK